LTPVGAGVVVAVGLLVVDPLDIEEDVQRSQQFEASSGRIHGIHVRDIGGERVMDVPRLLVVIPRRRALLPHTVELPELDADSDVIVVT
jgi:hypothetical protein